MTIAIIILAYVANVFLNRWLNKILYKSNPAIIPVLWFFSLIGTLVFIWVLVEKMNSKSNWFNWFKGKNW
jgi:uncharacterized membrane protein